MHFSLADTIFGFTPAQLALAFSGVAIIWTIRRWRMQKARTIKAANRAAPDVAQGSGVTQSGMSIPARHMREVTAEVQALLADLEETSRRLTAQLDNRYIKMEQLMVEADEKIKRLEGFFGSTATPGGRLAPSPSATPTSPIRAGTGSSASHAALAALSDAERTLQKLRHDRGAPPPAQDPAYQPVYSLSDLGKSPREIAKELNRQPGEIELILALRAR